MRGETILDALEEEEIVSEVQPELVSTNPAEDEDGRAIKRRKRNHYQHISADRERAREKSSLGVMRGCCQKIILFTGSQKRKLFFL